jgi:hypothetical protein
MCHLTFFDDRAGFENLIPFYQKSVFGGISNGMPVYKSFNASIQSLK